MSDSKPINLSIETLSAKVFLHMRDEIYAELKVRAGEVIDVQLKAVGCSELLELVQVWGPKIQGSLINIPLPEEKNHSALLMRELILRLQGLWQEPYPHEELCHCRVVTTKRVSDTIVAGAHTVEIVSRKTSAGTGCGTCRSDIQKIVNHKTG